MLNVRLGCAAQPASNHRAALPPLAEQHADTTAIPILPFNLAPNAGLEKISELPKNQMAQPQSQDIAIQAIQIVLTHPAA